MSVDEEIISGVMAEVEAVLAMYGDDCCIIRAEFPPHLTVHITPRTAEISSQQFVEAVIGIEAVVKYPEEPPCIYILDSKGLDYKRQQHLIKSIRSKSCDLSSCFMFVALCEDAIEIISEMNYPEGECPLCLYPLYPENKDSIPQPFMKLMSCFHCFHSGCISKWCKWLQQQNDSGEYKKEGNENTHVGNCPVCRKKFSSKDMEQVGNFLETDSTLLAYNESDSEDEKEFLQCDTENIRRNFFDLTLEIQRKRSGLFEPMKPISIFPRMFLPESRIPVDTISDTSVGSYGEGVHVLAEETTLTTFEGPTEVRKFKNSNSRRSRSYYSKTERKPPPNKKWIPKEGSTSGNSVP